MSVGDWLAARGAQNDVVTWAREGGRDWAGTWEACPRGDWLLGIAARAGAPPEAIARAARRVARFGIEGGPPALQEALDRAEREPAAAIELADALEASPSPDPEIAALGLAVACALRAATTPGDAAMVAALVVQAAALGAGDCAMMAAVSYAQRRSAEIVRKEISVAQLRIEEPA